MYDISVIVPVYNAEAYLKQCVESLLKQSKKNIEIVLVNDGSTDSCPEKIDEYARKYKHVVAVHQNNGGLAAARIAGFQKAKGTYIGWVDADDFIKPQMYETLYNIAIKETADLIYCDYEFYPKPSPTKPKWFREYKGEKNCYYLEKNTQFWNKLFSRELLEQVDLPLLLKEYGEYSTILPMLEAKKIAFTREKLYYYRVGQDSMSGGSYIGKIPHYRRGVEITKNLKEMIKGSQYEKSLDEYFEYRYIYTLILLALVAAKNNAYSEYEYAKEELKRLHYRKNRYTYLLVKESYGPSKAFVLTQIIPQNYYVARLIANSAI